MNTEVGKRKKIIQKDSFKLINNAIFGKAMTNLRKYGSIKHLLNINLLALEIRKTKTLMNNPPYLDILILDLSKTVKYEF